MCKVSLVPWSKNYVPSPQVVYCFNASTSMTVQKYLAAYSLHRRVRWILLYLSISDRMNLHANINCWFRFAHLLKLATPLFFSGEMMRHLCWFFSHRTYTQLTLMADYVFWSLLKNSIFFVFVCFRSCFGCLLSFFCKPWNGETLLPVSRVPVVRPLTTCKKCTPWPCRPSRRAAHHSKGQEKGTLLGREPIPETDTNSGHHHAVELWIIKAILPPF